MGLGAQSDAKRCPATLTDIGCSARVAQRRAVCFAVAKPRSAPLSVDLCRSTLSAGDRCFASPASVTDFPQRPPLSGAQRCWRRSASLQRRSALLRVVQRRATLCLARRRSASASTFQHRLAPLSVAQSFPRPTSLSGVQSRSASLAQRRGAPNAAQRRAAPFRFAQKCPLVVSLNPASRNVAQRR